MIKTKDLRRGNWVTSGKGDFPMYVTAIFEDEVYLNFEGNEGDVWESKEEDLQPIPITPEVLLKCGFGLKRETNIKGLTEYSYLPSIGMAKNYTILLTEIGGVYRLFKNLELVATFEKRYFHLFQNWFYFNVWINIEYKP